MSSITASGKSVRDGTAIMVKAFRDQPSRLILTDVSGKVIIGQSLTSEATIGLYREWVFRWNEGLFSRLTQAFAAGDAEKLAKLWQEAEPFDA